MRAAADRKGPGTMCRGLFGEKREDENVIRQKAPLFLGTAAPLLMLQFTPHLSACQGLWSNFSGSAENFLPTPALFFFFHKDLYRTQNKRASGLTYEKFGLSLSHLLRIKGTGALTFSPPSDIVPLSNRQRRRRNCRSRPERGAIAGSALRTIRSRYHS